ncbi:MAG TPA: urease accessory protein UreD [Stellaceae bacterium]|jgi:urease accessory protein|nr:urease accessory protein UreD [Stellaceae bacterium]
MNAGLRHMDSGLAAPRRPGMAVRSDKGGVRGIAEIGFAVRAGATRLSHLYERNPLRVLFPAPVAGDVPNAVLVTTSGGLVAGDCIEVSVRVEEDAAAHVTASAAEKIYRSTGATTEIAQTLSVEAGGWLEFLPPETILFDGARLRRETTIALTAEAGFLGGGILVFGRRARGEHFTRGLLHEGWQLNRDGRLVWGDALHIDGDIPAIMADPACFDDAAACATLILAPREGDPHRFVDAARAVQQQSAAPGLRAGVTAVGGLLVARWLGVDPMALRRAYADLACHLREAAMGLPARLPRLWHI